ncbi:MAG: hypothetical protein HY306_07000 [Nitrosomonadales bacterium]|nr:hypothetical protein [Nitrosomonadales bacterium]
MSPKEITPPAHEENQEAHLVERPDGFYWQDPRTEKLFGPFPTSLAATEDMQYRDDSDYAEGESPEEAEAEIGIDLLDTEAGELSESFAPHFSDE